MVGDSYVDIRTARNAGVASAGVTWGLQPESLEQAIDRRARDPEPLGELRGVPSLLPEPKHDLTDWDWDGARHSRTSQDQDSDKRRIAP